MFSKKLYNTYVKKFFTFDLNYNLSVIPTYMANNVLKKTNTNTNKI